ncbi:MAG: TonB-dependent receptor, partial [Calditrichaeota bacterium]|nr:TonB-dependent receptor [Calditrichota bacterium]
EALALLPGVTLLDAGAFVRISLRGAPPRMTLVELDGIPHNDPGTGETDLSSIALDRLARMEIDFTPTGGIIRLTSLHPDDLHPKSGSEFSSETGSYGNEQYRVGFNRRWRSVSGSVGARRYYEDGDFRYRVHHRTLGPRINNSLSGIGAEGRMAIPTRLGYFEAGGATDRRNRGVPGLIYSPASPEATLDRKQTATFLRLRVPNGPRTGTLFAYLRKQDLDFVNPEVQFDPSSGNLVRHWPDHTQLESSQKGIGLSLAHNGAAAVRRLSLQYARDDYRGRDLLRNLTSVGVGNGSAWRETRSLEAKGRLAGAGAGLELALEPEVKAMALTSSGAEDGNYLLPTLSVSAGHSTGWGRWLASAGWRRSITAPPFNAVFTQESLFATGNPHLKAERGVGWQAGIGLYRTKGFSAEANLTMSLFSRRISDLIVWRRNGMGKYYPDNLARAKASGIELSATLTPVEPISVSGSYIYLRSLNDTPGDINRGRMTTLTPRHSGTGSILWSGKKGIGKGGGLAIACRWASRRYSTESNLDPISTDGMGLDPFVVWDVSATKGWQSLGFGFKLTAGIDNLFDRQYRLVERSPLPGRTYHIRLTLRHHAS